MLPRLFPYTDPLAQAPLAARPHIFCSEGRSMYAVIQTGGKQERVAEGQRVNVERLGVAAGDEVTFTPILVVDGASVLTGGQLAGASVAARVVGEAKGTKIRGFTYKNKTNQRKRWGHRQKYTMIEITGITKG
ncbi:MAG: LSU ribosomal protein L21p [uncultured Acidimicrobiales bacterium]|uniref:Large ribosomal subunit protein bL21 n=1 Tax=uncultured Acidimicrobiales bacterium TaxID=310071 RepID=A0A6J4IXT1_9ACTN|nr:MAG: LSU ribosomal protein L21p [uncultured Acidimicrobiales bacterium]